MQKIFAVYAQLELPKATWLENFREKYDQPYHPHITLKQPCFINEPEELEVKKQLHDYFSRLKPPAHTLEIVFDRLSKSDATIMIQANEIGLLGKIRKDILQILKPLQNFVKEKYAGYEKDFRPHITIARDLDAAKRTEAEREIPKNYSLTASVRGITLAIVREISPEESKNPENLTTYGL